MKKLNLLAWGILRYLIQLLLMSDMTRSVLTGKINSCSEKWQLVTR